MFEKKSHQEAAGHNSGPQNKHTIVDRGCSWTTPLKNCLDAVFLMLIRHHIFGKLGISENFK